MRCTNYAADESPAAPDTALNAPPEIIGNAHAARLSEQLREGKQ
jgi:hypothetical protein